LNRLLAVATNTFRETVRERVLYNLVFFALVMTVSGFLLGHLSLRQDEKIIKDLGLAAIDFFGTLIAIFIGVGLVSKEIERRSLYPLLAKPLSRSEFFLGKYVGLCATLLVNTAVMTVGVLATLIFVGHGADLHLLRAVYPLYLGFLLVVALALLLSTLTSAALAAVGTVGVVLAGRYSDIIRNMRQVAPGAPQQLVDVLYYLLPNFANFDFKDKVAYGDPVSAGTLAFVTLYGALYAAILLTLGLVSFNHRDLQ
jgi:ABC-type transport system involved in multi-copper enzyme maturation permease subunit